MTKKLLINTSQQAPMQVDENGDTLRQVFGPTSPKYDCTLIKEDESDIEDEETSIKEVVFNAEKKKWLDKNEK